MPPRPQARSPRDAWLTAVTLATMGVLLVVLLVQARASRTTPEAHASASPPAPPPSASPPRPLDAAPAPSSSAPPARPPARKQAYVIAAIGDSLTDPKSHGGKYLELVQQRCPATRIDNYGRGADMVNQMRRRFHADLLPSPVRYTHLVVFGGVNDLYSDKTAGRTPEKIARDLLDMYTQASARGMKIVALTVAPWGGFTRYYNASRGAATLKLNGWIREQFDDGTVQHVVDAYALLSCGRPEFLCGEYSIDGIHFNAQGHAVLGEALFAEAFPNCK